MADILARLEGAAPSQPSLLRELRLGPPPEIVMLFSRDCEEAKLHYVNDATISTYLACPGRRCPLCYLRVEPVPFLLLPVLHVEVGEVKVLRIPPTRGANALADKLLPFFKDDDISNKVLFISRLKADYDVQARPLGETADRWESVVEDFLARHAQGLKLVSAFLHLTAVELADIPTIRRKLEAIGGWEPPAA